MAQTERLESPGAAPALPDPGVFAEKINGQAVSRGRPRVLHASGANSRHMRHEQILLRWSVLAEPWARQIERTRIDSVDRTPGAATFGR